MYNKHICRAREANLEDKEIHYTFAHGFLMIIQLCGRESLPVKFAKNDNPEDDLPFSSRKRVLIQIKVLPLHHKGSVRPSEIAKITSTDAQSDNPRWAVCLCWIWRLAMPTGAWVAAHFWISRMLPLADQEQPEIIAK